MKNTTRIATGILGIAGLSTIYSFKDVICDKYKEKNIKTKLEKMEFFKRWPFTIEK